MIFLVPNLLERSAVTGTSAATPVPRLYDRDPEVPWMATSNAQQDLDADQGAAPVPTPFSHLGLVGYTVTTDIQIHSGSGSPSNLRATITPNGITPRLVDLGGTWTDRYVRARILSGGVVPSIAELILGVPYIVGDSSRPQTRPYRTSVPRGVRGNVERQRAVGGRLLSTKLGAGLTHIRYLWPGLPEPEVNILFAIWAATDEGARPFLLQDALGDVRWLAWVDDEFEPQPSGVSRGVRVYTTEMNLESAA